MASQKFQFWTESELVEAIRCLEEAIANGVASASYPGGGNINYTSRANMDTALKDLYAAHKKLTTGEAPKRIRRVIYSGRKGL